MTALDVVAFIRARLNEHEAAALTALGPDAPTARSYIDGRPHSSPPPRWGYVNPRIEQAKAGEAVTVIDGISPGHADHVTLNDPVHVLAWVAAVRAVLDAHALRAEQGQMPGGEVIGYHATGLRVAIRALARAWRNHTDYRPEWG